jgi:hypothetical protein
VDVEVGLGELEEKLDGQLALAGVGGINHGLLYQQGARSGAVSPGGDRADGPDVLLPAG